MKKIIVSVLLGATVVSSSFSAFAAAGDFVFNKYDTDGSTILTRTATPVASDNSLFIYRTADDTVQPAILGSGLGFNYSNHQITVDNVPTAAITNLDTKLFNLNYGLFQATSTANGTAAQVGTIQALLNSSDSYPDFNNSSSTSRGYIRNRPSIPAAQIQSDWTQSSSTALDFIKNKPTLTSGTVTSVVAGTGLSGGTITSSGTISLPNVGTSGSYGKITTDAQGRVTAAKRQETYSSTSDGSGNYTVTFGTAFSAAPNIQANLIGGSDTQSTRITNISTTGFTVLVRNRTDIAGLLPTYSNVSGASLDVLVTEK